MKRFFLPVSTEPFLWYKNYGKVWEVRRYGRQYTPQNIYVDRKIEIRKGYTGESLWGKICRVEIIDNIDSFFKVVPFKEVVPVADGEKTAIEIVERILSLTNHKFYNIIGFKIELSL